MAAFLASGAIFGSALALSSVAAPQIIINQFRFADFHMIITFLTASACSAAIFVAANHTKLVNLACRKNSSFGWLGKYDGNVIGGLLLGVGMGLTGACPGTVLVQAAAGVGSSRSLLLSGLLGGIAFVKWNQRHKHVSAGKSEKHSVSEVTGLSNPTTILSYEAALLSAILAASVFAPRGRYLLHPVTGGILIGVAQISSVVFARKPLGASTAYEDAGNLFWGCVEGKSRPETENMIFVGGVVAGARLTMYLVPDVLEAFSQGKDVSLAATLVGGFTLIFGSRMAGGCPSGHGISGMSAMGISSFITVPCMFAGGILTAMLT